MRRYRMKDVNIEEVSYVDNPANRRRYLFIKNQGGEKNMDAIKLESLSYDDRRKLEQEVEVKLLPGIEKKVEEKLRADFEKTYTAEKIEAIKAEIRPDIEREIREEFGKQDSGVSKESAEIVTTAVKNIVRGVTVLSKMVGYGFKSNIVDEEKLEALEKSIADLRKIMLTEESLKEIVEPK